MSFLVSIITVLGVLIAAYLTAIVAEDYRRFRDGKSLAAALAGELDAYMEAADLGIPLMTEMRRRIELGESLFVTQFKPPSDPVYDAGVDRLGLLGPALSRDLAYTYQNLKAFKVSYATFTENYALLSANYLTGGKTLALQALEGCTDAVLRAQKRGKPLITALNEHASAQYKLPFIRITVVDRED